MYTHAIFNGGSVNSSQPESTCIVSKLSVLKYLSSKTWVLTVLSKNDKFVWDIVVLLHESFFSSLNALSCCTSFSFPS